MKRPSFQFYPADWLNDIKLQSCDPSSRGIFINMMCLMHQSDRYGYLLINGEVPPNSVVALQVKSHLNTYLKAIRCLLSYGVIHQHKDGSYYCKRMVEDERIRCLRAKGGKLGGNPLLKRKVNQKVKQKPTPSSSSSSSSSNKEIKKEIYPYKFRAFWSDYPIKKGKGAALAAWNKQKARGVLPDIVELKRVIKIQSNERALQLRRNEFVPEWKHPATWLNQRCWEDEPTERPELTVVSTPKNETLEEADARVKELTKNLFQEG